MVREGPAFDGEEDRAGLREDCAGLTVDRARLTAYREALTADHAGLRVGRAGLKSVARASQPPVIALQRTASTEHGTALTE